MDSNPHLATRLFNVPLTITPDKLEIVMAALADRFDLARLILADGEIVLFDGDYDAGESVHERPDEVGEGIAVIPVHGTLVVKLGMLQPYSGMTGYDGIRPISRWRSPMTRCARQYSISTRPVVSWPAALTSLTQSTRHVASSLCARLDL